MAWPRTRRYREVGVTPTSEGLAVTLDGQRLHSPSGAALIVPTAMLAFAIAGEWAAQTEDIRPETMALTRLANTVVDRIRPGRAGVVEDLLGYAATDLLCYRAAAPPDLAARQAEAWQPVLDWLAAAFDARLDVTTGIVPLAQPESAQWAIRAQLEAVTDWDLGGLSAVVQATGSLALGLAVAAGRLGGEEAWRLSQIDETYQSEGWGEDEAAAARRRLIRHDIETAARFLSLCRG